jgi:hypothetical protein
MKNTNLSEDFRKMQKLAGIQEEMETEKGLDQHILDLINVVDPNLSYKDLAKAIGKIIKNEYGTHLYKPFMDELNNTLNTED